MKKASLVLLVIIVLFVIMGLRYRRDRNLLTVMSEQTKELQQTKLQLSAAKELLSSAEKKLEFLNHYKTKVQVTGFAVSGNFANGVETEQSFAVPRHILPEDKVLNLALSPTAQKNLNARLNDYILLLDGRQQRKILGRFVDLTSETELRPVVDVFFATSEEARLFGRQGYFAVNISDEHSPFHGMVEAISQSWRGSAAKQAVK